jgi:hypothetical protein
MEGLRKIMNAVRQDGRYLAQGSNKTPQEYEFWALPLRQHVPLIVTYSEITKFINRFCGQTAKISVLKNVTNVG